MFLGSTYIAITVIHEVVISSSCTPHYTIIRMCLIVTTVSRQHNNTHLHTHFHSHFTLNLYILINTNERDWSKSVSKFVYFHFAAPVRTRCSSTTPVVAPELMLTFVGIRLVWSVLYQSLVSIAWISNLLLSVYFCAWLLSDGQIGFSRFA